MAFQRADPSRFVPNGFQHIEVSDRQFKVRDVSRRPVTRHEDWAIVTFNPMPLDQVPFADIRDTVRTFLLDHLRIRIKDIQRTPLGQALVQFEYGYDKDNLVENGSLLFGDLWLRFVRYEFQ